jgi:hypothetical protein
MTNGNVAPHRGGLILALGIIGLVACAPAGIFAWIMGKNDMKAMDAGSMDSTGRGSTQAGMICGIIATVLMGLALIGMLIAIAVGGLAFFGGKLDS